MMHSYQQPPQDLLTRELSNGLLRQGLELMVCGANVAFDEEEIIYGSLSRELDEKVAIIPDFIANCGVARLFSYLLSGEGPIEENAIFNDVDQIISKAVCRITNDGQKSNFLIQNALDLYL
ncbi:MAG: hypothetical protein IPM92_04840 [Saprospiraceae bacterium]|nr:hypothetical protein [Saprospiraceae bacterium]